MNLYVNPCFLKRFFIIIDPNVWYKGQETCNKICTIKSQNLSCSDNNTAARAVFQFDIKQLPINAHNFGLCKSCSNVTQINITCKFDIRSVKFEPHMTQHEEITTEKMILNSSGKCFSLSFFSLSVSSSLTKNTLYRLLKLNWFNIFIRWGYFKDES